MEVYMIGDIKSLLLKRNMTLEFSRRRKVDPRYKDAAYPEFVDRRRVPHDLDSRNHSRTLRFFREHHNLERKTVIALGVLVCLAVLLLFSIGFVSLTKTPADGPRNVKNPVNPVVAL